jgi:hypothetical protein
MAADDQKPKMDMELFNVVVALTSVVFSISRQVNQLKYIVFRKTLSDEEYEETRERQDEVFTKIDELMTALTAIRDKHSHG